MKTKKVANINIHLKEVFTRWLEISSFFHGLTKQQIKVLGLFLYNHYKLRDEITNEKILWKLVFDYDVKRDIKEELGITDPVLQNILTKFRKNNIIVDGKINKLFIPEINKDTSTFSVIYNFNIVHE